MRPKVKGTHEKFRTLYSVSNDVDFVIAIGGRGGMKTYEISKFAAVSATVRDKRVAVLRDEKESIRESILNEIFMRFDTANQNGKLDALFSKYQNGLYNKRTEDLQVFTKGFRASSNEKRSNLKGVSDVDIAIIEEAEDIRDFSKFATFRDSIRTQERMIIIILNTPDIQHWIVKRYFHLEPITVADVPELAHIQGIEKLLDGYWQLIPKAMAGFHCIQTNYEDNEHLPDTVIRSYKAYGDPTHPDYDLHYYLTAIKGFASSGRKGQVLRKVKRCTLQQYLELDAREIFGLDFGTSSPAGIVGVKIHKNNLYAREYNYKPLDTLGVAKFFCSLGLDIEEDLIVADSADPLSIHKLRYGWEESELQPEDLANPLFANLLKGWNIRGAIKGPGSIEYGLGLMNSSNLFFCEESANLWNEVYNYIYAQNKSGEYTNIPVDEFNHLIDPTRYVRAAQGRFF